MIIILIKIYTYNDRVFSYINVENKRDYYRFVSLLDKDEDGYDTELVQYKKDELTRYMEPIVIYSNNFFNKLSFTHKYKKIIEDELMLLNKLGMM